MRNLLRKAVLFLLCLPLLQVQAKDVYGFMTGNGKPDKIPVGMYKFDLETLEQTSMANVMAGFWGGAFAQDTYYFLYSSDYEGYIYNGLGTFNIDTRIFGAVDQSQPYQCSDLTYDVTTGTMYGIQIKNAGERYPNTLISIDLKTGMKTNIGESTTPVAALACNNWGELYAMGYDGNLYAMDKTTAKMVLVGKTGIRTDQIQAQSMDFDRETGLLYWTCLNTNQDALLVKLNIYAETPVVEQKIMKNNALIVGLHVAVAPIAPQAPAAVKDLTVNGSENKATLSWTNPTETYTGQTLGELTRIEIVRNNELIHTIEHPAAGAAMSWEDNQADQINGNVRYVIYACNEAGRSEGVSKKLIIGDDVPGVVSDFKLTADGSKGHLTWTAPTVGKNGGELTPANLRYTLTRMPDKKVFDEINGTSFTDETIETAAYYSYTIVCYNKAGKGNETVSEAQALGQPIEAPYASDFSTETLAAQWNIINANQDNTTWKWSKGKYVYSFCFSEDGDDHLVSVPFHLEKGVNYAVKYVIEAPSMFSNPEHFAVKVGDQVIEDLPAFNNKAPEERTVPFTVAESGNYSFTLSALSPMDNWQIVISSFAVEKMVANDLDISHLTLSTEELQEGTPATVSVEVTNKGSEDVSSYTVELTDQNQKILASQTINDILKKSEKQTLTFDWNPTREVETLTATVRLDGDDVADNNATSLRVYVLGAAESYVEFSEKTSQPSMFPFAFQGKKYAYAQAIYKHDELQMASATVNGLCYDYNNYGAELLGKHVRIYLANTEEASLSTSGWFDESDMTLVFDGIVDFVRGKHTLRMVFETPFVYTGQNLAVYTQKLDDDATGDINYFAKNYGGNQAITALYIDNNPDVSLNLVQGSTMLNQMVLRLENIDTAIRQATGSAADFGLNLNGNLLSFDQPVESVTVYDMNGKPVVKMQHVEQIDLSGCAQGVYLINLTDGNDQIVKKIVKK